MIERVFEKPGLSWVDVFDPSVTEIEEITKSYHLQATSIEDCLDPEHLPKFERLPGTTFLILRAYDENASSGADTVQELSRKIAIFITDNKILTIHRKDQPFLNRLRERWKVQAFHGECTSWHLVADILVETIMTYEKPIDLAITALENLETRIFQGAVESTVIEDGYFLRRKAGVFKRLLRLSIEVIPKLQQGNESVATYWQDAKETAEKEYFFADELQENVNSLLNLHLSLSSQRTNEASHRANEVMRVLTLFSVFFLPLNFIAGIYGMNFEFMPELKSHWGYPSVLLLMAGVSLGIFAWFRRRDWL